MVCEGLSLVLATRNRKDNDMRRTPMTELLEKLIEEADDDGVALQVQFKLGQPAAGALRRGPVEGIYEFCTVVEIGPDAPPEMRRLGDKLLASQYFEADAIQQVIVTKVDDAPTIHRPGH